MSRRSEVFPRGTPETVVVYVCTTSDCAERLRGVCPEPTFCSVCLEDLTAIIRPRIFA